MNYEDLETAMFNPNWIATCLHHYITGAMKSNENGIAFDLLFLALPLVQNPTVHNMLSKANSKSSFASIFDHADVIREKSEIRKAVGSTDQFRKYTSSGLIVLSSKVKLSISEYVKCIERADYRTSREPLRDTLKAFTNLGTIFGREKVAVLIKKLEVIGL